MSNDDFPFEVTGSKVVYETPWIKVREDAIHRRNGSDGIYSVIVVGESVAIVAVDDQGRICLVESYRHPVRRWVWELPGGGNDGEDPVTAGKRELAEETDITAKEWHTLGRCRVSNGILDEHQTNVLALDLTTGKFMTPEDETRARKFVSLDELDRMIAAGELDDNQSIAAIYMYKNWLQTQK